MFNLLQNNTTMKNKSWRTTIAGYLLLSAGIYIFITTKDWTQAGLAVTAGIGLILAKDKNVSGSSK